jgi:uncharacterized repeat protein (TIGR01451 family)
VISAMRKSTRSRLRRAVFALALPALLAVALPATASAATPGPGFSISAFVSPTNFIPNTTDGRDFYVILVRNTGSQDTTSEPITVSDVLPPGVSLNPQTSAFGGGAIIRFGGIVEGLAAGSCDPGPPVATCTYSSPLPPGETFAMYIPVNVEAGVSGTVTDRFSVSGGGAPGASGALQTPVSPEAAPFGFQSLDMSLTGEDGNAETRAGAHPYEMHVGTQFNTNYGGRNNLPAQNIKDIFATLPKGLVLNPHATTALCSEAQFETANCPLGSTVGASHVRIGLLGPVLPGANEGLYNLVPPPGAAAAFGFEVAGFGIFIHLLARVRPDGDYALGADIRNIPQYGSMSGTTLEFWGNPSASSHDRLRGTGCFPRGEEAVCRSEAASSACHASGGKVFCPTEASKIPLITMPSACSGPLSATLTADSWQNPGHFVSGSTQTTGYAGEPVGVNGCDKLPYHPANETVLSTDQAGTGTGLDFKVDFPDDGLESESALAESNTMKTEVELPEGLTINPSLGEGLGFCTPAQYAKETVNSLLGEGCPADSKLGTLYLTSPLVDEALEGTVFLAQQDNPETTEPGAENPFDTDIALYLVLKNPQLGIIIKKPVKVEPDPKTGQIVATLEDIPELPLSHFDFHFREGARAALISPSACGRYTTVARFYPYSEPGNPKTVESHFEISKGKDGGPCPPGGAPPFDPRFEAGSVNNSAGAFSPFIMRLHREDGEQDMTKFSAILPPGELGSLAGVAKCPDSAIADAKSKTGKQEKASPSCPSSSLIGHTLAGAGVGDALTYVPGYLYLGGPYHGDPLSVIAITPALAGPFDAGTIVVQEALTLNPKTAEVEVDGSASDPIPHILKGIPLKLRELRVQVDRSNFTLNPTSCAEESARSVLFGSNLNVLDPSDDLPVDLSARYQAADCQSLPFKPALKLSLKGGTRRGAHPALRAVYVPKPHNANIKGLLVRLPRSAFLDQAHIKTICTRVQFAAGAGNGEQCPKASRYGYVKAYTPLLDEPLEGPVFLRSSNHKLPDMVLALHGLVDVEVDIRIDSAHGGIRATMEDAPDATLSRVILRMQGAKKGLVVNSRDLCVRSSRANVIATGHNGKRFQTHPLMRAQCKGKHRKRHKRSRRHKR